MAETLLFTGRSSDRGGRAIVSPSSAADDNGVDPSSGAGDNTETSFISDGFNEDDSNDCIIVPEWPEERQQQHGNRLQQSSLAQAGVAQNYASLVRLSNNALVNFGESAVGGRWLKVLEFACNLGVFQWKSYRTIAILCLFLIKYFNS